MKPSVGRIVRVCLPVEHGEREFAAIITRVWTEVCVNVAVFVDANGFELKHVTQVPHQQVSGEDQEFWFWPPREEGSHIDPANVRGA